MGQADDTLPKPIDGEISADKCSKEDEVMEEEIVEDSDKEGGDESGRVGA